jgi:hypothetical protein
MPTKSASIPVIGTPMPPVTNPMPSMKPDAIPARPRTMPWAITSVTEIYMST